jgi:polysaccharide export outer membrane protein
MRLIKPVMAALFLSLAGCARAPEVPNIADAPEELRTAPTPAEFQLGPGDRISIQVWRHEDLNMDVTISPDGSITYPLVGQLLVSGKTYAELVSLLSDAISEYYEDPQVTVNIVEIKNQKILVVGEVATPTVLQLSNQMSILEALTLTGGINPSAKTSNVLLIRGGVDAASLYTVDVHSIYSEGNTAQMIYLQRGDIVVVPTRTITNVSRYFRDVQSLLAPFVAGSAIFRNAVSGGAQGTSSVLD